MNILAHYAAFNLNAFLRLLKSPIMNLKNYKEDEYEKQLKQVSKSFNFDKNESISLDQELYER